MLLESYGIEMEYIDSFSGNFEAFRCEGHIKECHCGVNLSSILKWEIQTSEKY